MIHIFMAALVGQWQQLTGGGLFHNELNIIRRIVVFAVWLWLLLIAHSVAMVSFEGMSLADALWLSITTIIEESVVRTIVPKLKAAGARGIVEYAINKIID